MTEPSWLGDTRESYDTLAADYADLLHDELAAKPLDRAVLAAFARLVHADGPVADVGCGPGRTTAHLASLGVPVRGIDLSPFVRKATAGVPRPDLPNLTGEADVLTVLTGGAIGVSLRTVERYLARRRVTGSLAATEQRHGPEPKGARAAAGLAAGWPGRCGRCHAG